MRPFVRAILPSSDKESSMTFIKPAVRAAGSFAALGLGLVLAAAPVFAQAQAERPSPTGRSAAVRQTTLLVEDIDRALDFYMRLGLTKVSDRTYEEGSRDAVFTGADLPLTADPKTSRLVVIRGGDQGGMIGLLSYDRPRLSSARGNLSGLGTGDIIVTIEVADIQEAYKRLSQTGTRFQKLPYRTTVTGSDGAERTVQRMLAFDPDGHLAEVVQSAK
jgi:catechol 2,3-dioxygenase-like lactoylglutathione lyase family enzyme